MQIELLVDNRDGNVFDISELIEDVTWKTKRKGSPSSLDVTFVSDSKFKPANGNVVSFKVDGYKVFYGFIFEHSGSETVTQSFVAYDQLRYLLFNDTYVFVNKRAHDVIHKICDDLNLRKGVIEDTLYTMPTYLQDDKKLLDIIYGALEQTVLNTKQTFVLYDSFGSICCQNINNMRREIAISDDSNLGGYDYKNSIDGETYNRVKFVKDNEESGGRDVYIAQDSANIAKWGRLQLYKKVDENMNKAQISEMLDATLKLKNREEKSLKLKDVLGVDSKLDLTLRAGSGVTVIINKQNIKSWYLIEEATHKFTKNSYVMDFDLKVV